MFEVVDLEEEEDLAGQALEEAFHILDTPGMQLEGLRSSPAQLLTSSPNTARRERQSGNADAAAAAELQHLILYIQCSLLELRGLSMLLFPISRQRSAGRATTG